jgi:glutaconate CoA-transferase subunit B
MLVITPRDKRRFAPQLDFLTTPGYLTGPGARERAGLPLGMGFHPESKRMQVESLHPGVMKEDVIANTGFELLFVDSLVTTPELLDTELRILREEVDPQGMIIGKRQKIPGFFSVEKTGS